MIVSSDTPVILNDSDVPQGYLKKANFLNRYASKRYCMIIDSHFYTGKSKG